MSAKGLLTRNPHPSPHEVQAAMTGNICRCSNYNHYVEAVMAASKNPKTSKRASGHSNASNATASKTAAEVSGTKQRRGASISTSSEGGAR
jgi:xanthine dehydrogenase iron-sulfur cluster and FAD-binding subunit A